MDSKASRQIGIASSLALLLCWAYWPTWVETADRWASNSMYSHGYLVPVFALFLLWCDRGTIQGRTLEPSWWGLPLVLLGMALHLGGAYFFFDWLSGVALLPTLAGLAVSCGGWPALRWSWRSVGFLAFMLPLPYQVEVGLGLPLQGLATRASTYLLQTLGIPAVYEGTTIIMDRERFEVAQACNGLGMTMTFFALTTAVALVMRRNLLDKAFVVLSAVPIALFANVVRITVASLLGEFISPQSAGWFHDSTAAAGLMMALALLLVGVELWALSRLLVEAPTEELEPFEIPELAPAAAVRPGHTT